jgi:ATP-binding cassette subfamily F protein 3
VPCSRASSPAKNLLILDEPTNHLDIPSAERLEDALAMPEEDGDLGYEGTLLLISHDRALIDSRPATTSLVLDGKGNAEIFLGNYTEWHEKQVEKTRERAAAELAQKRRRDEEAARAARAQDERRKLEKARSQPAKISKYERMKTDQIEQKIEEIERRLREIDQLLGDPQTWSNTAKAQKLGDERAALAAELEPLEFEWSRRAEDA